MTPQFKHDCERCTFIGRLPYHDEPADWYVCPQGGWPTIVARYSDVPWEYASGETLARYLPADLRKHALTLTRGWRKHPTGDAQQFAREQMQERRRRARQIRRIGLTAYLDRELDAFTEAERNPT